MTSPQRFKILHISDFHCASDTQGDLVIDAITPLLKRHLPIDFVAFTGDLFVKGGEPSMVEKVCVSLNKLKDILQIEPKQFLFVPGNQDVIGNVAGTGKTYERFKFYITAINRFMAADENGSICWFDNSLGSADILNTATILPSPKSDIDVEFLLMNSVCNYFVKEKRNPPGSPPDICIEDSEIEYFRSHADISQKPTILRIALVHNSLINLDGFSRDTIKNFGSVRKMLEECHVGLLLHGDRHDSQQSTATKGLNSWPLYVLGAGQIDPEIRGADAPHFHILEITKWDGLCSAELEVLSYVIRLKVPRIDAAECYHLCTPIKDLSKSYGSIHTFESAQLFREKYQYRIGKDLLFKARANSFKLLNEVSEKIFVAGKAKFQPDQMYLLFYKDMFNLRNGRCTFWAVHDHDWKAWLKDSSVRGVLEDHKIAAITNKVNIQRVIILRRADIEKMRTQYSKGIKDEIKELLDLCKMLSEYCVDANGDRGYFNTFLTKEENLNFYARANLKQTGYDNPYRNISAGNIALLAEADDLTGVNQSNSLVFYFDLEFRGRFSAWIAVSENLVNHIKGLIDYILEEKDKFTDCRELINEAKLKQFIGLNG